MGGYLKAERIRNLNVDGVELRVNCCIIPDYLRAQKDVASYVRKGEPMKPGTAIGGDGHPRGITVHNTDMIKVQANTTAAEQYCRATYNGNMGGVVVHYYVWHDVIWQLLEDSECGWHAGDGSSRKPSKNGGFRIGGNLDTVAIEAIGADAETEETTALLVAALCREHGLKPETDVYPHKYWSGKECPVYILPHWAAFLRRVADAYAKDEPDAEGDGMTGLNPDVPPEKDPPETSFGYAADAWKAAYNTGILDGTRPRDYVRREELALILQRLNLL